MEGSQNTKAVKEEIKNAEEIHYASKPIHIIISHKGGPFRKRYSTNILKYLDEKYKTHQIILFTCTNREKEILEKIKVPYNLIEL